MKDLRVTVRVRNNRIISRREKLGWTQAELARRAGIPQGHLSQFECLQRRPMKDGLWLDSALLIGIALGCSAEDLWPDGLRDLRARQVSKNFSVADFRQLSGTSNIPELVAENPTPEESMAGAELREDIARAVSRACSPREIAILSRRFGLSEETLEEVGQDFEVTGARIREIESRALRKLMHPCHSRRLIDHVPGAYKKESK